MNGYYGNPRLKNKQGEAYTFRVDEILPQFICIMAFLAAPVVFSSTLTSKPSSVCKTEIHVSLQLTSHLTFEVMITDLVDAPASNEREEGWYLMTSIPERVEQN